MKAKFRSRMKVRLLLCIVFLLTIALTLQACSATSPTSPADDVPVESLTTQVIAGSQAASEPGTTPGVESTEQSAKPTETNPPVSAVLRLAVQPIVQTDPAFISSDPEVLVASQVYDYLVDVSVENTIEPSLATEWEVSEDGLEYEFKLAEGVTFHDGSAFTAEDVVWTFDRLRHPDSDFPTRDLYSNIATIEATSDYAVKFTLVEPNPFFLYDLSDNHALMLNAGTVDAAVRFNGTGPFRVVSYSVEDRLILEANPDYFLSGMPSLTGLEIVFFNDQAAMVDALRGGQVDLVFLASATDLYASLQGEPDIQLLEVSTNQFDLVRLRADRPPGNDPRLIQALKYATDREAIFQLVLQRYGSIGRDSPIGPLYSQYYIEETPLPERNVELARQLLVEAGYENGLNLELYTPDTGNRPNLAVVLKEQWAEAGVNVDVIIEPESVYYGDNGWLEVDLGITGWGSRPYPQFYFDTMLACDAVWNEAHFCDAKLDALIKTAGSTLDEAERIQAYKDIQRVLIERGPVIIPYFAAQFAAISDLFQGIEMKAFWGRTDLHRISLVEN